MIIPSFCITRSYITVFMRGRHSISFWARLIQSEISDVIFSLHFLFRRNKRRLMTSPCSLAVCLWVCVFSPNFWSLVLPRISCFLSKIHFNSFHIIPFTCRAQNISLLFTFQTKFCMNLSFLFVLHVPSISFSFFIIRIIFKCTLNQSKKVWGTR
jgi:hypothetical protein